MCMLIVGIERVNYESKKTGKQVMGYQFYCTVERTSVIGGIATETIFVNDDGALSLINSVNGDVEKLVGVEVRPYRNRFGGVEELDRLG